MLYFRQNTAVRRKFFYLFRQPGSAFRFRLVVHGDGDPPFDGRQQMAVPGKKTDFLYGVLFFCPKDMGRLISERLYYLFNGMLVL